MFYRSLKYGIVVDDIANRKRLEHNAEYYRRHILSSIRFAFNGEFPVKSIFLDHCLTLGLHTIVCCLIYGIFDNLAASLLFAVNVGNNQVSLWLNGKRYAVNAILCLIAFSIGSWGVVFWLLTAMFQVSAVSFPFVMLLAGSGFYILMIPLLFIFGNKHLTEWIKSKKETCKVKAFIKWDDRKIVLFLKTIAFYFMRGVFPYVPTMYPEQFKRFGLINADTEDAYKFDVRAFAGLFIIAVILFGYCFYSSLFFGLMWWLITIAVFGNLVTLTVPLAERYMYLPNIGLMLFLSNLLGLVNGNAWLLFFIIYSVKLQTFMPMYYNIDDYLKHHCFYYPKNDQAWIFRVNRCTELNDVFGVMNLSNDGLVANQDSSFLWLQRAIGFISIGKIDMAKQCVEMARRFARDEYSLFIEQKINDVNKMMGVK